MATIFRLLIGREPEASTAMDTFSLKIIHSLCQAISVPNSTQSLLWIPATQEPGHRDLLLAPEDRGEVLEDRGEDLEALGDQEIQDHHGPGLP